MSELKNSYKNLLIELDEILKPFNAFIPMDYIINEENKEKQAFEVVKIYINIRGFFKIMPKLKNESKQELHNALIILDMINQPKEKTFMCSDMDI